MKGRESGGRDHARRTAQNAIERQAILQWKGFRESKITAAELPRREQQDYSTNQHEHLLMLLATIQL